MKLPKQFKPKRGQPDISEMVQRSSGELVGCANALQRPVVTMVYGNQGDVVPLGYAFATTDLELAKILEMQINAYLKGPTQGSATTDRGFEDDYS